VGITLPTDPGTQQRPRRHAARIEDMMIGI
jgi:hypothetical protein